MTMTNIWPIPIDEMRYLFYIAHPSHYYVFRRLIEILRENGDSVLIIIRVKDILEDIVRAEGHMYYNVTPKRRQNNRFSIALDVIIRNIKVTKFIIHNKIDRIVSCGSDIGIVTKMLGKPHFLFNDDDYYIVPNSAKFGWPFVSVIFAPTGCDMGKFKNKTEYYNGFQKLFYLHEKVFKPNIKVVTDSIGKARYYLIRTVSLDAHHDTKIRGLNDNAVRMLISKLEPYGKVFISSEKQLLPEFDKYRLRINPTHMHDFIFFCDLLIADSQSMVHEAALLGTPSIRCNDFVGKIGVLEVLEKKYGLTIGIEPGDYSKLEATLDLMLSDKDLKVRCQSRAKEMLSNMIDVNAYIFAYLNEYRKLSRST